MRCVIFMERIKKFGAKLQKISNDLYRKIRFGKKIKVHNDPDADEIGVQDEESLIQ